MSPYTAVQGGRRDKYHGSKCVKKCSTRRREEGDCAGICNWISKSAQNVRIPWNDNYRAGCVYDRIVDFNGSLSEFMGFFICVGNEDIHLTQAYIPDRTH